jgi:hypothetical protein
MIVVLSQTWLLSSSLRHNCCSPLSYMIIVFLSQTCSALYHVWERRTTIMSERGE